MAQRTNNKNIYSAPSTLPDVQFTTVRQQKQWMCPICGVKFEQEYIKDVHMHSCKRRSLPYQQHVIADNPMKTSQSITLHLHTCQFSEAVCYISDLGGSYSLTWDHSKSLYTARVSLNSGQNKGSVHFMSTDKCVLVKSFEVLQHPINNNSIEIFMRENVAIPNAYTAISPRLKCNPDTTPLQAQTFQKKYQDEDIYANVSQMADNIRMSHQVDELKERVTELENENSILKEESARSKTIIDDFHARRIELESELARLKNDRGFENNLEFPPKHPLNKPVISPRPDK